MRETSSSRSCWRNSSTPLASMASNVTPSMPGAPLLAFAAAYAVPERLQLAHVDVQPPEPPGRFGLRLGVDPPLQVLQLEWTLLSWRPCLPCWPEEHEQQGPFAPAALPAFLATPDPSATVSSSAAFPGVPGYTAYPAPPISRWDEDGFSSCSTCPVSPCCPYHPAEVTRRPRSACRHAMLPSPRTKRARPSGLIFVEATCGFTCVTAR